MSVIMKIAGLTRLSLMLVGASVALLTACSAEGPEKTILVASQGVLSASLSSQGETAFIGSIHHGGSLWSLNQGERIYNWNHEAGVYTSYRASAFSADGRVVAAARDRDLLIWDSNTGQSLNFWRAQDKVLSIALTEDGSYAVLGLPNNQAVYFDVNKGSEVWSFSHRAEVRSVGVNYDGQWVITGSDDLSARIWQVENGQLVHSFEHENQIKTVAVSPDGKLAFTSAQREDSVIWDVNSGSAKVKLDYRRRNFTAARFSEDGRSLLLGTFRGEVIWVNTSDGSEKKRRQAKPRQVYGASSSSAILDVAFKGSKMVGIGSDGIISIFD